MYTPRAVARRLDHLVVRPHHLDALLLAIDLNLMRQMIWERDGDHIGEIDHSQGDYPRWIDTSVMIADPLTKTMKPDVLVKVFSTGIFDMRATPESLAIKEKTRQARQKTRSENE